MSGRTTPEPLGAASAKVLYTNAGNLDRHRMTGNTNGGQTVLAFCAGPGTVLSRSSTVRLSDWD